MLRRLTCQALARALSPLATGRATIGLASNHLLSWIVIGIGLSESLVWLSFRIGSRHQPKVSPACSPGTH